MSSVGFGIGNDANTVIGNSTAFIDSLRKYVKVNHPPRKQINQNHMNSVLSLLSWYMATGVEMYQIQEILKAYEPLYYSELYPPGRAIFESHGLQGA